MEFRKLVTIICLLIIASPNSILVSASILSGDSYSEPVIDGVISDREYYNAESHYIYLQSSGSRLHTMLYANNDRDFLYLAFKIEERDTNNLMVLRLADAYGNIVSKHSRFDEPGWSLYFNGEDFVEGDLAGFSSVWGSEGFYRVVEWKIPLYTDNENDLKIRAGEPIRFAVQYGLDGAFTYPYTYDYKNPRTWGWLTTITPSPIKNGGFEEQILINPWQVPGWKTHGWMEPVKGRDGMGIRILEGDLGQTIDAKEGESLFFLYLARPEGREVYLNVALDSVIVYEDTMRGNNTDHAWTEVEIKFSEIFKSSGVRSGDIPLKFHVVSSTYSENETHSSLLLDSVQILESSPTIVVDEIYVEDERCDIGFTQIVGMHFSVYPKNIDLRYTTVDINGTTYISDSDGWVRFSVDSDKVTSKRWVVDSVNKSIEFETLVDYPKVTWDSVVITIPDFQRVGVGGHFDWSGRYNYDGDVFVGELVLSKPFPSSQVGLVDYEVIGISDSKFGLNNFIASPFRVIYDKIELSLSLAESRIDVGEDPDVSYSGKYLYDSSEFVGSITLTDAPSEIGKFEISIASIIDSKHGLSVYESGSIEFIRDIIRITQAGTSLSSVNVDEDVEVWFNAEYAYDLKPFTGDDGKLYVNGEEAFWKNGRWVASFSSDSPVKESYRVTSVVDDRYGLSSFSTTVDDVEVEWKKPAGVPGFQFNYILFSLLAWILLSQRSSFKMIKKGFRTLSKES